MSPVPRSLFGDDVPSGFRYSKDFLGSDEEGALLAHIGRVEFSSFEMRGVVARRRVAFFGRSYDAAGAPVQPLPAFLTALRERIAIWSGIDAAAFVMALLNEYPPGAPIGWHRDAPEYGVTAGVSLLSPCRMKFRPYMRPHSRKPGREPRTATHEIALEPRSAYLLTGASRSEYEHHIPPVTALRYSITFRTLKSPGR